MEENNQKIKCEVQSCKYNGVENDYCKLEQITVKPFPDTTSRTPEETICSNYRNSH